MCTRSERYHRSGPNGHRERARDRETVRSAPTTGAPDGTEIDKDPGPERTRDRGSFGSPRAPFRHSIITRRSEQTSWSRETHLKEPSIHQENVSTELRVDEVLWVT